MPSSTFRMHKEQHMELQPHFMFSFANAKLYLLPVIKENATGSDDEVKC